MQILISEIAIFAGGCPSPDLYYHICSVNFGICIVELDVFAKAGDTVKIVAHVNPAKTDFVQEDAVLEFTVE